MIYPTDDFKYESRQVLPVQVRAKNRGLTFHWYRPNKLGQYLVSYVFIEVKLKITKTR